MGNLLQKAIFDNTTIPLISKLVDLSALRQKLISSNIANVNTPGYQRKDINFEGELKKAFHKPNVTIQETHPNHIPLRNSKNASPEIKSTKFSLNSTGVNTVDIDQEMAGLAQNHLVFNFGSTLLGKKFRGLKMAIRGKQ